MSRKYIPFVEPKFFIKKGTPPKAPMAHKGFIVKMVAKLTLDAKVLQPLQYIEVTPITRWSYLRIKKLMEKQDLIITFTPEGANTPHRGSMFVSKPAE